VPSGRSSPLQSDFCPKAAGFILRAAKLVTSGRW
jgi:hypothetical protein